jgi:hypothetical protein
MFVLIALAAPSFAEPDHETHEALRALFQQAQQALNERRLDELHPLLTHDFEATTITQEPITGREGVDRYFDAWFGPDKYMKSMRFDLEADALTDLSADQSWGIVRGTGVEHYEANEDYTFDFATRWTAVVERGDDAKWRIRSIHIGTNNLDNPVLTRVKSTMMKYGVVGALVTGLLCGVLGFVGGRLSRR